jgi:hypothetical protein
MLAHKLSGSDNDLGVGCWWVTISKMRSIGRDEQSCNSLNSWFGMGVNKVFQFQQHLDIILTFRHERLCTYSCKTSSTLGKNETNSVVNQLTLWSQDRSVGIVARYELGSIPIPVGGGGWPFTSILCCGAELIECKDNSTQTGCALGILQPWFGDQLVMVKQWSYWDKPCTLVLSVKSF